MITQERNAGPRSRSPQVATAGAAEQGGLAREEGGVASPRAAASYAPVPREDLETQ